MYPLRVRTTKLFPSWTRTSSGCQPAGNPDSNVITYWCRSSVTICLTAMAVSIGVALTNDAPPVQRERSSSVPRLGVSAPLSLAMDSLSLSSGELTTKL